MRSYKQNTVQLPVEIQLSDDTKFLQKVLQQSGVNSEEKLNMSDSDSEGSVSDLDCSAIIQDLDNENTHDFQTLQDVAGSSQQKQSNAYVRKSDPDVQAVINAQILEQLEKICECSDKIESKECKKASDQSKVKVQNLKMLN